MAILPLLVVMLLAGDVAAVRLEMKSPAGCASADDLARRTLRRSGRIRFVGEGERSPEGVPVARVEITRRGDGSGAVTATLTVIQPSGRRAWRQLTTKSCEDAAEAVALVLALTLDPTAAADGAPATTAGPASPASPPSPSIPPPSPAPSPAPSSGAGSPSASGSPSPNGSPPSRALPARAPPPDDDATRSAIAAAPTAAIATPGPSPSSPSPPAILVPELGALAGATWGPAPRGMPELALYATLIWDRGGAWSPSLRLVAGRAWSGEVAAPGGTADFTLDVVALAFCPARLALGPLEASVCAGGAAGRMTSRGSETLDPTLHIRPWVALAASGVLALSVGHGVELSALFEAGFPVIRDSYQFAPAVFHRVPAVVGLLGAGVGVRFR